MCRCLLPSILLLILAGQEALVARPEAGSYQCEAPPEILAAINQASLQGIESLLKQDPDNFWLLRAYIDSSTGSQIFAMSNNGSAIPRDRVDESVIARFKKDYETRPADPKAAYLYAYALVHRNTAKSIEILTELTQGTPSFPNTFLTLAALHTYTGYYDMEKQRKCTEEYIALCPNTIEPRIAELAARLDKSDIQTKYAKALRARIAGKADEQTVPLFTALWNLESKSTPPAGQAEFKKRIEGDLEFLEGLNKAKFRQVDTMLAQGYQRIGNKEAIQKMLSSSSASTISSTLFFEAQSEWQRANPAPASTAGSEVRTAYYRKQLQFLDEWQDKAPQLSNLLTLRITALALLPDTPDDVLVREGNQALETIRKSGFYIIPTGFLDMPQVWAQRGLELDRIPALVKEIMERQPTTTVSFLNQRSDLYGDSSLALMTENTKWTTNTRAWAVLVTAYAKSRQFDQARVTLAQWEKGLNERRKKADATNEKLSQQARAVSTERSSIVLNPTSLMESALVSGISSDESRYYNGCAQLAVAEGRSLDALAFYQSSLRLMYGRSLALPNLAELEAAKSANTLWKNLGGTDAGWTVWLDSIKTMPVPKVQALAQWSVKNLPIPQFSLTDQDGKTWTLDRLKGKTTLINIWATWCAPCRSEIVLVQKLYEQIKDRDDIQVITLNVDEDVNLVEPFLKEQKLSMPSLLARGFVNGFSKPQGIPTSWISDASGTIRFESLGFGGDSSNWIPQILKQLESVQTGKK